MEEIKNFISNSIDVNQVNTVLELGIGIGDFMETLLDCFNDNTQFTGIDIVDRCIDYSRERFKNKNVDVIKMSADELAFPDNSFDIVCISNTLHHIEHIDSLMDSMKRVVKPTGYILINEMINDNQSEKQMVHVNLHHFGADIDMENGKYHGHTFSTNELEDLIASFNLSMIAKDKYTHQEYDDELVALKAFYKDLKNKITSLKDENKKAIYMKALESRYDKFKNIGFQLATKYVVLVQKNSILNRNKLK